MEQAQAFFTEGVLSHLEMLESLSCSLAMKQEQSRQKEDVLQAKKELILKLKTERDELQAKVRRQKEEIQVLSVTDEGSRPPGPSTREALQELRLEEMKGAMEGLWFTGISGKKTDNGICFCLSTSYEGHYLDSYYIQVDNLKKPRIIRHSMPAFIPLLDIARSHLQSDLKKFLLVLFDHLNGFAGRKFQADRLQDAPSAYIPGTLHWNSLYTVLSFSYNVTIDKQNIRCCAKLLYGAANGVLPTDALVICPENVGSLQEVASSHTSLFRSKPLHRAVESLTLQEETRATT